MHSGCVKSFLKYIQEIPAPCLVKSRVLKAKIGFAGTTQCCLYNSDQVSPALFDLPNTLDYKPHMAFRYILYAF